MRYKGFCEEYGGVTVAATAILLPGCAEAGLSHVFNYNADYMFALGAGAWSYCGTHYIGRSLAERYLHDKGAKIGPTRASKIMKRFQAAVYAGIVTAIMGTGALLDDPASAPEQPSQPSSAFGPDQLRSVPPQLDPAPNRFLLS